VVQVPHRGGVEDHRDGHSGFLLLKELSALVFVNLFFIWPLALFIIFYKSDAVGAEKLLKFLCVLTLVLWVIFIVYFFFSKGIDHFLFQDLKKMVPDAQ
jgi:cytosine/uracil/thiamine/allantoin permease